VTMTPLSEQSISETSSNNMSLNELRTFSEWSCASHNVRTVWKPKEQNPIMSDNCCSRLSTAPATANTAGIVLTRKLGEGGHVPAFITTVDAHRYYNTDFGINLRK
jgi:hypothetical protein